MLNQNYRRKENLNMTKKKTALLALALIAAIATVSAGLLEYYGRITGTVDVSQSVTFLDGTTAKTFSFDGVTTVAGATIIDTFVLKNRAEVDVPITFETNVIDGITTTYYDLSEGTTSDRGTMVFQGTLAKEDGVYSGEVGATGVFDIYAKEGSIIQSSASSINGKLVGSDHDAWPNWTPDVPDFEFYSLNFSGNTWTLYYKQPPGEYTDPSYTNSPMSGVINWDTMFATETGNNWEADWVGWVGAWGYENVQLQTGLFAVDIESYDDSTYTVTFTPIDLGVGITDLTIPANAAVNIAIVNEFAVNLAPATYTITTTIKP